jgi:WhiB family redox-sensing transcriptional regulator
MVQHHTEHAVTGDRAHRRLDVDTIPQPPDWTIDARCADIGPDLFFPDTKGQNAADAKQICRGCPVVDDCLEYALYLESGDDLSNRGRYGIYGGHSPRERAAIARTRKEPA